MVMVWGSSDIWFPFSGRVRLLLRLDRSGEDKADLPAHGSVVACGFTFDSRAQIGRQPHMEHIVGSLFHRKSLVQSPVMPQPARRGVTPQRTAERIGSLRVRGFLAANFSDPALLSG